MSYNVIFTFGKEEHKKQCKHILGNEFDEELFNQVHDYIDKKRGRSHRAKHGHSREAEVYIRNKWREKGVKMFRAHLAGDRTLDKMSEIVKSEYDKITDNNIDDSYYSDKEKGNLIDSIDKPTIKTIHEIYNKCLSDIGGKSNKDINWYFNRHKTISRQNFFEQTVHAIWVSGMGRKQGESFLKRVEENGFDWDYAVIASWNKRKFYHFVEKAHKQRPVPKRAYNKWESIYCIAKQINRCSSEVDFRASFFDGKIKSADLNKNDVQNLISRHFGFIANANARFILRNMGGEFIKPDRWIEAFLSHYRMSQEELENRIIKLNIPLGIFDVVVWAYCEEFVVNTKDFNNHFKKVFA